MSKDVTPLQAKLIAMIAALAEDRPKRKLLNDLRERYYALRQDSAGLRAHSEQFEGMPWTLRENMAIRRSADGWELRVHVVDGDTEACVIQPDGQASTFA